MIERVRSAARRARRRLRRLGAPIGSPVRPAPRTVDLRVLVLAVGCEEVDLASGGVADALRSVGVPHDVVDVSTEGGISDPLLRHPDGTGRYNGIVLTVTDLRGHLSDDDWHRLHSYEREFGVREAVLSGYPTARPGLDYGMDRGSVTHLDGTVGRWTDAAQAVLPGLRYDHDLPITDFGFSAAPRADGPATITPLLVRADAPTHTLVSVVRYDDGREVLLSTLRHMPWQLHAALLGYAQIHFATRGLHLGAPRVQLTVHVDDLFVPSPTWDPVAAAPDQSRTYRLIPSDLDAAARAQQTLVSRHRSLDDFRFDLAFNGVGAAVGEPLTEAVAADGHAFRYLNHTWSHSVLDAHAGMGHTEIVEEIVANLRLWDELSLPGRAEASDALVTGGHSGLRNGDTPYPRGCNPALCSAATEAGVRCIAGDSSSRGQEVPTRLPATEIVLVPRTALLYYDVSTPGDFVDQFDWRHRRSLSAAGSDPSEAWGGVVERPSYEEAMAFEAAQGARMLTRFDSRPHFAHQANLRAYDDTGASLLSDWLEFVLDEYERHSTWPIENPSFAELGRRADQRLRIDEAGVRATVDVVNGEVSAVARAPADIEITGLGGGSPYGPVELTTVSISADRRGLGVVGRWRLARRPADAEQ